MTEKYPITTLIPEYYAEFPTIKSDSAEWVNPITLTETVPLRPNSTDNISIFLNPEYTTKPKTQTQPSFKLTKAQEKELLTYIETRVKNILKHLETIEKNNGFIGKSWSWLKNTKVLDWCTSGTNDIKKAQEAELEALKNKDIKTVFKEITGNEFNEENIYKFLNGEILTKSEQALEDYAEGQEMATDAAADIVAGVSAAGIFTVSVAAAPFSGGTSIVAGLAAATASGAAIKTSLKYADAKTAGRNYTGEEFKRDAATGAFSGVLAPVTGGLGGAAGKTVASKVGIQAVKQGVNQGMNSGVRQTIKTALTNPTGYEYVGGNFVKRSAAYGTEFAVDGALGGSVDNAFRTAYDGGNLKDVSYSAIEGGLGGFILSPIVGGSLKGAGKVASKTIDGEIRLPGLKKLFTADDVKKFFPSGRLEENAYTNNVKKLISEIAEEVKNDPKFKTVDLSPELTQKDYETIAELMNLHKDKHLKTWLGKSDTDDIPNIQKLALFARVLDFTHQKRDFLQFDENQWDIVVEGIIKKPEDLIYPVLKYKLNSSDINRALDTGNYTPEIKEEVGKIQKYINLFETKQELIVYRGEGRYGILNTAKNAQLGDMVEEFTRGIRSGQYNAEEIEKFIKNNLTWKELYQKRFLSTAMTEEATEDYRGVIFWEEITIPQGTKGASIESYCVERKKEAEFLIHDGTKILITSARYDRSSGLWILKGKVQETN